MAVIYGKIEKNEEIKQLIKELEVQKDILEKFEHCSDYDRGLFQGKISMIDILIDNLKKML